MRIAVIDLGTNTFNLLIANVNDNKSFTIEMSAKHAVQLGKGGINNKTILPDAIERGLKAIEAHMQIITHMGVDNIYAYGTSAIRNATNSNNFINLIKENYNVQVEIITGNREAELIYHGVAQAVDLSSQKHLIMDIGGGSNELIIANHKEIFFKHSFPLGISRLLDKFTPSDPITADEVARVEEYLEKELQLLFDAAATHMPKVLVGSSGSFDTYRSVLTKGEDPCKPPSFKIEIKDYLQLHKQLLKSNMEERLTMPGMEPMRVEMIVLASIFTRLVIEKIGITHMVQSCYALKEGAVWDIVHHHLK
ncbi:Ppx/GppA phosphatase family protein [Williamwhitmania taraxaci]|uniref:Exopolyphosphatase / guanosine-5'-triphosphate,3'-diphosphate pyrophosphatase n=1 Tax=Williamwhitmania taraxaci TaxID=1640674 RepID=A0A1G6HAT5_9BACT|nr:hypothetical protein [Williamwhitmania taraxaci]SDB91409.1 exopolyphosphatase / guanosine-5'-triphosphate,3'-diphosphate pyrophosphatase [Williamwhitmania taraxaci]